MNKKIRSPVRWIFTIVVSVGGICITIWLPRPASIAVALIFVGVGWAITWT